MPDSHSIVHLQKLADAKDFLDPRFDPVIRKDLKIRYHLHPRTWEFVMGFLALEKYKMLESNRRGISFGSGREPLIFAVATRVEFLCVTDFYGESSVWDTAATGDAHSFVLGVAPIDFDSSRIEVRSMDMREVAYPDGSFDFAYSISAFEHIGVDADFLSHLREVRRVLKPGGVYVLTTELRIGGNTFRVEGNYAFALSHLFDLFRQVGFRCESIFDARLDDRNENEGRAILETRHHDVMNSLIETLIVREFGGVMSAPALFILRPEPFEEVEVIGLEETATWLRQRLDYRIGVGYSDWTSLNPYGLFPNSHSPYCDLWAEMSPPKYPLIFGTSYQYFGNGVMEIRVILVPSPDSASQADLASQGRMLLCVNSWSLEDVTDVTTVFHVYVDIHSPASLTSSPSEIDEISAKRARFQIDVENNRSYSVFAALASGEVLLSEVSVMVRRIAPAAGNAYA